MIWVTKHQIGTNSGFNASTNHFILVERQDNCHTADHAKHQPIAVVTLKVKDNAPDGAQAINLTTFNGVDANLDKVGATMNSTSVTIGGAVVPTATAVPVPPATQLFLFQQLQLHRLKTILLL